MLIGFKLGATSIVLRVKLLDSAVTTGAGKTGLSSTSTGLIIAAIADNEAATTAYTQAGSTIESITTLGTFATPTATKCRFKELDATNHKGVYEIQFDNARYNVSSSKYLTVSLSGVSGVSECDFIIPLTKFDPYDAQRAGLTALPAADAGAANGLIAAGTGTNQLSVTSGQVLVQNGTATGQISLSSGVVSANVTQNAGSAITSAGGRQEVNVTHNAGTAITSSGGIQAVNTTQWRGVQPANLDGSARVVASAATLTTGAITAASFATDAIDANALKADAVAELVAGVRAMVIESNGSITLQQALDGIYCVCLGVTTSGGSVFKDPTGTTTRATFSTDGSNNRLTSSPSPSA